MPLTATAIQSSYHERLPSAAALLSRNGNLNELLLMSRSISVVREMDTDAFAILSARYA